MSAVINRQDLRLIRTRSTWSDAIRTPITSRKWILLPLTLVVTLFFTGFCLPAWQTPAGRNELKKPLRQAVFRFDTRIIFSCEQFAHDIVRRPMAATATPIEDPWERIKLDSRSRRSSLLTSHECLVQAGLMVV